MSHNFADVKLFTRQYTKLLCPFTDERPLGGNQNGSLLGNYETWRAQLVDVQAARGMAIFG